MSRKTLFEQGEGRTVLKIKKYVEDTPVWKSMAHGALTGILLYLIILFIAIMIVPEWFSDLHASVGDIIMVVMVAVTMALFAVVYSLLTDAIYRMMLGNRRSTLCRYKSDIRCLEKINREQESTKS